MKYAIISDLHANAEALQCALKDIAREGVDCIACLGDIVGYGPQPREALTLVRRFCGIVLAGNHDDAVAGRITADDFIDLAGEAIIRHRAELASEQIDWLKSLPHLARIEGAIAAHGDVTNPTAFNYISSEAEALANFKASKSPLLFVGHTHSPGIFVIGAHGIVHQLPAKDFQMEAGKRYIVNPGSVGYPREANGVCHSSYVLYDSAARTVEFRFLPFSVASVMARGKAKGTRRRILLAAVALGAAALAALLAFVSKPATRTVTKTVTETKVVEVEKPEDPALLLARKELTLKPDDRKVRANLRLASGPAELTIEFRDPNGHRIGAPFHRTIKESYRQAHKIPEGACAAIFTVRKTTAADASRLAAFAPAAAPR